MATRENIGEILEARGLLQLPAVEVGVAEGEYSKQILEWGTPFLYLVDLWANHPGGYSELTAWDDAKHAQMLANTIERLSAFEGKYKILRGWSHEMCREIEDNTLGFAYIDASHDYDNVLRDLNCYWPKLTADGIMAGHDWPIEGVSKAVKQFAEENNLKIHLLPVNVDDASFWLERI